MKHHPLKEVAKVGVGLVLADIISIAWFSVAGLLPMSLLGVTWTASMMPEALVFDVALLVVLVHFAWNVKMPINSPSERSLLYATGIIFLFVAIVHLVRIAFGFPLALGTVVVPMWVSWVGVIVAGYLSYASFHFSLRKK